jgi:DNA helicase-2/ATP-dependent DNA helicase PcrA
MISSTHSDETKPSETDSSNDEKSRESFLESVEGLAIRQKNSSTDNIGVRSTDLPGISIDNYPEVESTERTVKKIEELKSIISAIESRPSIPAEINLDKTYRINYRNELNPAQLEAVSAINGPALVIAGAGSGKTRVIVYRVAFMMENGISPDDILLLTFTRKAAREMLGRVQQLLKDNAAQKVFGGTFHAFSNHILRKYANMLNIPVNFTIIDEEDSADTIDLIRSELKIEKKEKAFPRKNRIQEIISSARNRNLSIRDVIEN